MSDPDRWIVIPRWDEFQHRDAWRSRTPAWIKIYTELHHNDRWLNLTPADRSALIGIWIEYASARGQLPINTASLSRRLNQRVTIPTLERLNHAGFIHFSASKPASDTASNHASPEESREEKKGLRPSSTKDPTRPSAPRSPNAEKNGGWVCRHPEASAEHSAAYTFAKERQLREHLTNHHWMFGESELDELVEKARQ